MLRAIAFLGFAVALSAAELTVSGSWVRSFDVADLASGAGSDFASPVTSASGACVVNTTATGEWTIKVRRASQAWPVGAVLWIRRSSSGSGTVTGGEAFTQVGATDLTLLSGSGDCANIAIQFRVTGISSTHAPGTYLSDIIFTIQ